MKGVFCVNLGVKHFKSYVNLKQTCIRDKVCTIGIKSLTRHHS